jgi:hypothetical protein
VLSGRCSPLGEKLGRFVMIGGSVGSVEADAAEADGTELEGDGSVTGPYGEA